MQDVVELGLAAQGLKRRIGLQVSHFVSVPFLVAQSGSSLRSRGRSPYRSRRSATSSCSSRLLRSLPSR